MSATNEFRITQITDNGQVVQIALIENVSTEPISQKQMTLQNVVLYLLCYVMLYLCLQLIQTPSNEVPAAVLNICMEVTLADDTGTE